MKPIWLFSFCSIFQKSLHHLYSINPRSYFHYNPSLDFSSTNLSSSFSSGLDERFPVSSSYSSNKTQLLMIHEFFEKYYFLSLLEDNYISVNVKLNLMSDYYRDRSIVVGNLEAGGLYKDWI